MGLTEFISPEIRLCCVPPSDSCEYNATMVHTFFFFFFVLMAKFIQLYFDVIEPTFKVTRPMNVRLNENDNFPCIFSQNLNFLTAHSSWSFGWHQVCLFISFCSLNRMVFRFSMHHLSVCLFTLTQIIWGIFFFFSFLLHITHFDDLMCGVRMLYIRWAERSLIYL